MGQYQVRNLVALIVIFGHIGVFLIGFFLLGIFGPVFSEDTLQIILMASPVLALAATSAIKYILHNETVLGSGDPVSKPFAIVTISIPIILLCLILCLFLLVFFQVNDFTPTKLKISLGVVETFFGVFIGLISDKLFAIR